MHSLTMLAGQALTAEELSGPMASLLSRLPAAVASGGGSSGVGLSPGELALLPRLLAWPSERLFPALDVCRAAVLDAAGAAALSSSGGALAGALSAAAGSGAVANLQVRGGSVPGRQVSWRSQRGRGSRFLGPPSEVGAAGLLALPMNFLLGLHCGRGLVSWRGGM
eukprot:346789-Chlamydomonas_euryale.AAC.2